MKRKTIFLTIILMVLLMTGTVYATDSRISEEELEQSSKMESTEINRESAVMLLSDEITVVGEWNISNTESDNVIATLYNDGTFKITGTGNMKDYSTIEIENREHSPWYDNRNDIKNVQIGNDVNNIGEAAFFDCRQLINITIPEGLTNIGEYAFWYCTSLTKIVLPESISNIGGSAFSDCRKLSDIIIPNNVTEISRGLFSGCEKLESINIPEGVTIIGRSSFSRCNGLTNINIPASVKIIEETVFWECDNLESIEVNEKNSYFMDAEGVLFNKDKTELICYPSNKSDKEYNIPETVETIKAYSIAFCRSLEKIVIQEGTKNIEAANFHCCSKLKNITIPKTVTNINGILMSNCTSLEKINVYCGSYSEEYIKGKQYSNKMKVIHDYQITYKDENVCKQGGKVIYECSGCKDSYEREVTGHTVVIDVAVEPSCIETGLTEGSHCSVCNEILVEQQVVAALEHDYGEWNVTKESTNTEKGEKQRECNVCKNIEKEEIQVIDYEKIVKTWDVSATEYDNVIAILYNDGTFIITGTGNMRKYSGNGDVLWSGYMYKIKYALIDEGVKNISNYSFFGAEYLENLTISEGVETIGSSIIAETRKLTDIEIPSSVTKIETGAFSTSNTRLVNIKVNENNKEYSDIDGVLYNKNQTELICYPIGKTQEKYIVPSSVKEIAMSAFYNCINLKDLEISEGLEIIHGSAFENCSNLTNINIPEGVKRIYASAFAHCRNLENINLPTTLESLNWTVFMDTKITNITIPSSVKEIGKSIFQNCLNLEKVNVYCNSYAEEYVRQNYSDKLSVIHNYEDKITEPTCTEQGYITHICIRCSDNKIEETPIEALGHDYKIKETTDAVCEQGGKITYECSRCKDTYDEDVQAKGHSYGEWIVTKSATCTEAGSREKVCSVCQEKQTEEIAVLGHSYGDFVVDVQPTCIKDGEKSKHCTRCNDSRIEITVIDSLGHNFGAWVIDKEPTYEEEGHKYRVCINCNTEKEEQAIPVLTKDELQVSTKYTIKEKENVKHIILTPGTTINKILENITANKEIKVVDKSGNELNGNNLVGTGAKVVTKEGSKEIYTVVVKGDANGDGKIDFINDIIRFNNYRLNLIKLDIASMFAADIDDNGKVDFINDIIKVNNYRLGIINSL